MNRLDELPEDVESRIFQLSEGVKGLAKEAQLDSRHHSVHQAAATKGFNNAASKIQAQFKGRIERDTMQFLSDQKQRPAFLHGVPHENIKELAQTVYGEASSTAIRNSLNRDNNRFEDHSAVGRDDGASMRFRNRLFKLPLGHRLSPLMAAAAADPDSEPNVRGLQTDFYQGKESVERAHDGGFTNTKYGSVPQPLRNKIDNLTGERMYGYVESESDESEV